MPAYRVEVSSTSRAGCNATHCKKEGVKIQKGELRQGAWVEYEDRGSYKWRHWGCVTPEVLHNWHEASEGNTDLIDGFDDLPDHAQAKVQQALEQGHVDDEEWNGDIECNRWTGRKGLGMFVKGAAKKEKDAMEADAEDEAQKAPAKKTTGRKRKAAKIDDDEQGVEEPVVAKKGRGKKAKVAADEDEDEAAPPVSKRARAKKPKAQTSDLEDNPPVKAPATKKGKGKKSAPIVQSEAEDEVVDEEPEEDPKPAPKKKAKKTATSDAVEKASKAASKSKPTRKTKSSRAAANADED